MASPVGMLLITVQTSRHCAQFTTSERDKAYFDRIREDNDLFQAEFIHNRRSLFDVLVEKTSISFPFGSFLASLPPMGVPQYSISLSPPS